MKDVWERRGELARSPEWALTLVSRESPLPVEYEPELRPVDGTAYLFDLRAADSLERMLDAARSHGLSPVICSAYRSVARQRVLYDDKVRRLEAGGMGHTEALAAAAAVVAYPGTSEHHLGLAADLVSAAYQELEEAQEGTPECRWLHANCFRFGFVLRYPRGRTHITGIVYEPWHFRYVGPEAASDMTRRGICLEEYLLRSRRTAPAPGN